MYHWKYLGNSLSLTKSAKALLSLEHQLLPNRSFKFAPTDSHISHTLSGNCEYVWIYFF